MSGALRKPMFIYISGPYSASQETPSDKQQEVIASNVEQAEQAAVEVTRKGHLPFVPHTMMRGWEDTDKVTREQAMEICQRWIEKCDALFFLGPSDGAELEQKQAVERGIPIYRDLSDVPEGNGAVQEGNDIGLDAQTGSTSLLSSEAFQGYITEYEQCMESYRHTYATIWQAGGIFAAISAAIVAFGANEATGIPPWILVLAPVLFLFWWWGIFRPMNRYGEWRNDRLAQIEEKLSEPTTPGLQMRHFSEFSSKRKGGWKIVRILTLQWLWRSRVKEVVTIFGCSIFVLELILLWNYYFSSLF